MSILKRFWRWMIQGGIVIAAFLVGEIIPPIRDFDYTFPLLQWTLWVGLSIVLTAVAEIVWCLFHNRFAATPWTPFTSQILFEPRNVFVATLGAALPAVLATAAFFIIALIYAVPVASGLGAFLRSWVIYGAFGFSNYLIARISTRKADCK